MKKKQVLIILTFDINLISRNDREIHLHIYDNSLLICYLTLLQLHNQLIVLSKYNKCQKKKEKVFSKETPFKDCEHSSDAVWTESDCGYKLG